MKIGNKEIWLSDLLPKMPVVGMLSPGYGANLTVRAPTHAERIARLKGKVRRK